MITTRMNYGKENCRKMFQETMSFILKNKEMDEIVEKSIEDAEIFDTSVEFMKIIDNGIRYNTHIDTVDETVISATNKYDDVVILNFADGFSAGGGTAIGCNAQEECICRSTTLYPVLISNKFIHGVYYKHKAIPKNFLETNIASYTPNVLTLRNDYGDYSFLDEHERKFIDVISVAAPDLRYGKMDPEDELIKRDIYKKMKHVIFKAIEHEKKTIILGAFGCGAFLNSPFVVSEIIQGILNEDYINGIKVYEKFQNIIFSVRNNGDELESSNYTIFKNMKWR